MKVRDIIKMIEDDGWYIVVTRSSIMYRYLVIFEKAGDNYSAYSLDIPGCIATGKTREEVERSIKEPISFHIEGLIDDGFPVPEPTSFTEYVEV